MPAIYAHPHCFRRTSWPPPRRLWRRHLPTRRARSPTTALPTRRPKKACESLSTFKGKDIVAIQARVVPATADTPQHCRVIGTISPEVAFEINLPDRWNQRFYMTGNGGLAGDALDGPTNPDRTSALTNGFVMARTNTGHDARKEPSGSFILSNPQKAIDYAYRAVHVTAETAKDDRDGLLRAADQVLVLELLLERRPSGAARGAAIPR